MDFQIYFCVDGILRAKFSEEQPLIPIKFLQEKSHLNQMIYAFVSLVGKYIF